MAENMKEKARGKSPGQTGQRRALLEAVVIIFRLIPLAIAWGERAVGGMCNTTSNYLSSPQFTWVGEWVLPKLPVQKWHLSLLPFFWILSCSFMLSWRITLQTVWSSFLADNLVGVGVRKQEHVIANGTLDKGRNPGFEASYHWPVLWTRPTSFLHVCGIPLPHQELLSPFPPVP